MRRRAILVVAPLALAATAIGIVWVAVDPASYQALSVTRIAAGKPSGRLVQIVTAETLPLGSGDFQTQRTKKPRHL